MNPFRFTLSKIFIALVVLLSLLFFTRFGYQHSIAYADSNSPVNMPLGGRVLLGTDTNKLVVMEATGDPDVNSGYYRSYQTNQLTNALQDLYNEGKPDQDYIMYIGATISAQPAAFTNSAAGGTFAGLRGRIANLVLTGTQEDLITDSPATAAPAANLFNGTSDNYFGCNLILRNIRHNFTNVYMQGNDLTLGGNSWQTGPTNYYGGSKSGDITPADGTAELTINSTGSGETTLYGGMAAGTLYGNTSITVNHTSGNAISIYGGGRGSASNRANVTGNVTNTINELASNTYGLSNYYGGTLYGDIGGRITNTIRGQGRFNNDRFVGGSQDGSIGNSSSPAGAIDTANLDEDYSSLEGSDDYAIKNWIDTSQYSAGRKYFIGANENSGMIYGNMINIVKAGADNRGSYSGFQGGGSLYTVIPTTFYTTFTHTGNGKIGNVEQGIAAAELAADFRIYGNIINILRSGCFSSGTGLGYLRGAGYGGYIEGDVYSALGTDGIVYKDDHDSYTYRVSANALQANQGLGSAFDIAGGGGSEDADNSICIVGDTTLVTKNVLASFTYGGSFGGVHIGDSLRIHKGGIVDTCEGSGYSARFHAGNSRAEVWGGQVEWFLSGGGWNDNYQDGNVSVEVYDSPIPDHPVIINASMGGTYGAGSHLISGDSTITIRGGNFSGIPRDGTNGFSAGPQNSGTIYGNTKLTIDLRGNVNGFQLASNDNVSGGRSRNAPSTSLLGTNEDNTIELNIFTDPGNDLLKGLNIYGDACPTYTGNTRSGHITININAPGSNIGNLFATNYINLTGSNANRRIWRDTTINLVAADTVNGLSSSNGFNAGTPNDSLNNAISAYSASQKIYAIINVGPQSDNPDDILGEWETSPPEDGLPHNIQVGSTGINGFTSMNIRKRLLTATDGTIKNGGTNASLSTYNDYYSNTGHLTLYAGQGTEASGIGVGSGITSPSTFVAGNLNVSGEGTVYIESSGIKDQVIINQPDVPKGAVVTWLKENTISESNWSTPSSWLAMKHGWYIFTTKPTGSHAKNMTPFNLDGLERTTRKAYIGDNVVESSGVGYAVCFTGSIYKWKVTEGDGDILHNVDDVYTSETEPGYPVQAIGTVGKDIPSTEGRLMIPSDYVPSDFAFSFTPKGNGWVKGIQIHRSDEFISTPPPAGSVIELLPPNTPGETAVWQVPSENTSYSSDITAQFEEKQATLRLVQKISNFDTFQEYLQDRKFNINLTGAVNASITLGHDETSPNLYFMPGEGDAANIHISEIVPMEFDRNYSVIVEIKRNDTVLTLNSPDITILPNDEVTITIMNTYEPKGYFKGSDYLNNIFSAYSLSRIF